MNIQGYRLKEKRAGAIGQQPLPALSLVALATFIFESTMSSRQEEIIFNISYKDDMPISIPYS
ncbi:MAG: hypothetical protein D3916_07920 [Candidatus Electrothrix sp. MAN1_4]|nr:hypothetical protein [Candidatus Electrothrix sp. MAN1_4]